MGELIKSIDFIDKKKDLRKNESFKEVMAGKNSGRKLYIESYGCQMNFADSEIVSSILNENGFETTNDFKAADVILVNTCSIRDKAEQTVRHRL